MDWHFLQFVVGREWVWGVFLNGFCVHLTRPLALAVVVAIVFFGFGRGIGLPSLFLPKRWPSRFTIGAGLGVLVWQVMVAGYLFEEFATNYTSDRPPFCEVQPPTSGIWSYADADYTQVVLPPPGQETERDLYRFRYPPAGVTSIVRYTGAVLGAALAVGAVGLLFWALREVVLRVAGGRGGRPTPKAESQRLRVGRYLRLRAPFLGGVVLGWLVAVGVSWAFLPGGWLPDVATGTGEWFVRIGGWGHAAAREALIDDAIDLGSEDLNRTPKDLRDEKIAEARAKFVPYYPVYGIFFLGFAAVLWFNVGLLAFTRLFSPAAGILLLAHLAVGSQTFIDYFFPTPQLLQFLLLGLIVLCARRYKMRFAALAEHYREPVSLDRHYAEVRQPAPPAPPAADEFAPLRTDQLTAWNEGPKKPLMMVCVSGGGSRAAAWTVRVLTELERRLPEFPYHVRMVTGASGGIFGAAYYTASLPPPGQSRLPDGTPDLPPRTSGLYPSREQLNQTVRRDFLSPVVRALIQNDLVRQFQPFQYGADRGTALETAWSECLGGWLDQSFADLWAGEKAGWRPSLVFSPMLVEDGRQLVISNLSLRRVMQNLGRTPGTSPDAAEVLSREGLEFFQLFPKSRRFPLSTAARMSATFPYVFPAVPLPTVPRRRVVDAGYYDNYGVSLAASWLFTHMEWLKARVSRVAIVHIRDGVSTDERQMLTPVGDDSTAFGLATEGLTTPPAGLWSMRSATNTFRNDNLLHLLNLFFVERAIPFVTTAFEFPAGNDVSLNFTLPEDEAALIDGDQGIGDPTIHQALNELERWWG